MFKTTGGKTKPAPAPGAEDYSSRKPEPKHRNDELRDQFAGVALAGLITKHKVTTPASSLAEQAYAFADAMLQARDHDA